MLPEMKKFPFPQKRWFFNLSDKVLKYRQTAFNTYLEVLISGNKQQYESMMEQSRNMKSDGASVGDTLPLDAASPSEQVQEENAIDGGPTQSQVLVPDEINLFLKISQHVRSAANRGTSRASNGSMGADSRDYSYSARHAGGYGTSGGGGTSRNSEVGSVGSRDSTSSASGGMFNGSGPYLNPNGGSKNRAASFGTLTSNIMTVNDFKFVKVLGKGR